MLDDDNFIGKWGGMKSPIATLIYQGEKYGLWSLKNKGVHVVSHKYEPDLKLVISGTIQDHHEGTYFMKSGPILKRLVDSYDRGLIFFEDGACKNAFIDLIGYNRFKTQ